jgi:hypothetical protein
VRIGYSDVAAPYMRAAHRQAGSREMWRYVMATGKSVVGICGESVSRRHR